MSGPDAAPVPPSLVEAAPSEALSKGQKLEFRLKVLQQFTTLSVAGAGLSLTLIGTVFDRSRIVSWIPVAMFLCAALLSMVGQIRVSNLAEDDSPILPKGQGWTAVIAYFLGAGIASLCVVVLRGGTVSG